MRPTTVVLCAAAAEISLPEVAAQVGTAANVTAVLSGTRNPADPGEFRAVWSEIERAQTTYVLTDVDPLEFLRRGYVTAWHDRRLECFDVAALEAPGDLPRPDFYLVLDDGSPAEDADSERALGREWYFGVVASAAPARVVAIRAAGSPELASAAVREQLGRLPAGVEIPSVDELAECARRRVPGHLDLGSHEG